VGYLGPSLVVQGQNGKRKQVEAVYLHPPSASDNSSNAHIIKKDSLLEKFLSWVYRRYCLAHITSAVRALIFRTGSTRLREPIPVGLNELS